MRKRYARNQYPNILKALKTLEKLGLIISTTSKSEKNVPMKLYHCTLDGIFYALAKNPKANILKTLDANENLEDRVKAFRASYDIWGPELFLKFVRDMDEFLPMINKDGLENIMPYILMKMTTIMGDRDLRTRIRIAEETMEQFPDSKRIVKELTENLNKLF